VYIYINTIFNTIHYLNIDNPNLINPPTPVVPPLVELELEEEEEDVAEEEEEDDVAKEEEVTLPVVLLVDAPVVPSN
jgi:hypothetical protein